MTTVTNLNNNFCHRFHRFTQIKKKRELDEFKKSVKIL